MVEEEVAVVVIAAAVAVAHMAEGVLAAEVEVPSVEVVEALAFSY